MKDLLKRYVEAYGPSGYEDQIRALVLEDIKDLADDIMVDPLGNVLATKYPRGGGGQPGKRVLIMGHMDEIGVIITHIDKQGFLRFTNIGGVSPLFSVGGRVRFADGTIGVIGRDHGTTGTPTLTELFIDVGATSPEDCPVQVGDAAVFWQPMLDLTEHRIAAKSVDDRVSLVIMIEALRRLSATPHEVVFAFSVQEEVGTRGAGPAAFTVDPDLGLSIDVTRTGDIPKHGQMEVHLGKGPAIKVRDSGMLSDPRLVRLLRTRAQEANIPFQLEILDGGSTDARAIQVTRGGVPSGCISIPCRHIHSPSEVIDLRDVEQSIQLLIAFLTHPIDL